MVGCEKQACAPHSGKRASAGQVLDRPAAARDTTLLSRVYSRTLLPESHQDRLLEESESAYHQEVGRVQQRAVESYFRLFRARVHAILATTQVNKEDAKSIAADDLEEEWKTIEVSRNLLIEIARNRKAMRDALILEQARRQDHPAA